MADIVSREKRSLMMSGIKGSNTKPEKIIRHLLHKEGFRYRLHSKKLPGRPDLVLTKFNAVILVHGCFWHNHDCHLFKIPSSNTTFWKTKIRSNHQRDKRQKKELMSLGWRVLVVWECSLRGKTRLPQDELLLRCINWLKSNILEGQIRGNE